MSFGKPLLLLLLRQNEREKWEGRVRKWGCAGLPHKPRGLRSKARSQKLHSGLPGIWPGPHCWSHPSCLPRYTEAGKWNQLESECGPRLSCVGCRLPSWFPNPSVQSLLLHQSQGFPQCLIVFLLFFFFCSVDYSELTYCLIQFVPDFIFFPKVEAEVIDLKTFSFYNKGRHLMLQNFTWVQHLRCFTDIASSFSHFRSVKSIFEWKSSCLRWYVNLLNSSGHSEVYIQNFVWFTLNFYNKKQRLKNESYLHLWFFDLLLINPQLLYKFGVFFSFVLCF